MSASDNRGDKRGSPQKSRKEEYKERYERAKSRGESFFPHTIFADAIASLVVFVAIVALAIFVGAGTGPIADPSSTTYNPRPEWYFLFLFQLLKFFPGRLEPVAITVLPAVGIIVLLALPFVDRGGSRHPLRRPVAVGVGAVLVLGIMFLTYAGFTAPLLNPPSEESPAVAMGHRIFRERGCLYCHSIGGEGGAVGPDLTNVASRRDRAALLAYLADPESMIPHSLHPKLQFTDQELQDLAAYLLTLGAPVTYSAEAPGLFNQDCASCHTIDGSGGKVGPDLSRVGSFRSVGYLAAFIKDPESVIAGGAMPAFEDKLSEAQISDLAAYLSSFKGSTGSTTTTTAASTAQALFAQKCAGCHSAPPGAGLTAEQAAEVIRNGRGGMPSFAGQLTSTQIEELGAFLANPAASTTTTTAS